MKKDLIFVQIFRSMNYYGYNDLIFLAYDNFISIQLWKYY